LGLLNPRFLRRFYKVFSKLSNENKERIQSAVDEILNFPKRNSKFAKGQWRGKRERRVGSLRIMYTHCSECREERHISINNCPDCDSINDDVATFWTIIVGHKF